MAYVQYQLWQPVTQRPKYLKEVGHIKIRHRPHKQFFANHPRLRFGKYAGIPIPLKRYSVSNKSNGLLGQTVTGDSSVIPKEFDWRMKKDTKGRPIMHPARDQGACGSCYAFCVCGMLSARFAISTDGEVNPVLSVQDMVTCGRRFIRSAFDTDYYNNTIQELIRQGVLAEADWYALEGCEGGLLVSSLDYVTLFGLPEEKSKPYESGRTGYSGNDEYCEHDRENIKRYYGDRTHTLTEWIESSLPTRDVNLSPETLKSNIENMQLAIMTDGPIITSLNIYTDLLYYPHMEDVYQRRSTILVNGQEQRVVYEGGHAVVLVGWGETTDDDGTVLPYWIALNSWGTDWGKDGYFYIKRGENLCNVEFDAYALFPNLSGDPVSSPPELLPSDQNSFGPWLALIIIGSLIIIIVIVIVVLYFTRRNK